MAPRVSVIVATHNQAPYLGEAIDSVLSQAGVEVETIIVDDASTDSTPEVLSRYGDRIRVIRMERNCGGPALPRNAGMKAATGHYIAFLDGDDLFVPGKLAEQAAFLEARPDVALVFSNFRNFDERDARPRPDELSGHGDFHRLRKEKVGERWYVLPERETYETLIGDNFIGTCTVMLRRSVLETVGDFDDFRRSEDIAYWFRISRRCTFGYVDAVLCRRRLHGGNISASPEALSAKIEIYRREKRMPMSPAARRMLGRMMGKLHYSIGFIARSDGRRWTAIRHFLASLACDFNRGRALASVIFTLLPSLRTR